MKTNTLYVLSGIPGSGKSSWVNQHQEYTVISPDSLRREILGSVNNQNNGNIIFNASYALVRMGGRAHKNVVFDATNTSDKAINKLIKSCGDNFTEIIVVRFHCEAEVAIKRIKNNIKNGIDRANVPEHVVWRMHNNFKNLKLNNEKITKIIDVK
jgi:predicted kinase